MLLCYQTYVFGVCMDKCDLRYLLRANDRLMVDLVPASEEERTSLSSAYGGDVQNLASRVWLGFAPKSVRDRKLAVLEFFFSVKNLFLFFFLG